MLSVVKVSYTPLVAAVLLAMPVAWADGGAPTSVPEILPTAPAAPATPAAPAQARPPGSDPAPGDTVTSAFQILGRPNGQFDMANEVLYMFDRGSIMVAADGIVQEVNLTPAAKYQAMKAEEAQQQNELQAAHGRANALLNMLLSDPAYLALATRDRILALKKFDREHPGSDAPQDIADLTSIYNAERAVQVHLTELEKKNKQAQDQTSFLQQRLNTDEKALAALRQRTEKAEQQAAQAAAQPPQVVTNPMVVGPTVSTISGPTAKVGGGGAIAITPGGAVVEQPARPVIVNGSATNSPTNGTWVLQPDGTIKMLPAQPAAN